MTKESRDGNARDNIESLAKNVVQELETMFFGADHELLLGTIAATVHSIAAVIGGGDAS